MDDRLGAYRGSGLSAVLGRFAFLIVCQAVVTGLCFRVCGSVHVIFKGLAERLGYMHSEPASIRWRLHNKDRPSKGLWFGWRAMILSL